MLSFQEMRQPCLVDRDSEVPWDPDLMPTVPDELLDPDWQGAEVSASAEVESEAGGAGRPGSISGSSPVGYDLAARVERTGLLRKRFVMWATRGRVLIEIGGNGRDDWTNRIVADTEAAAAEAFDRLRGHYRARRYVEVPWGDNLMPPLPDELFDPHWDGSEVSLPAAADQERPADPER